MARERPRWTLLCANVASYVQLGALHIYSSSENFLHRKLNAWARRKRWHMSYLYRFKSLLIPAAGPTLRYEGHFESPGFVWQGWVLTPPSWPCLSLPSPAVWVNGEPRNGEEILHVTPPTYAPTIGGLLTKPSTIPNPRLSPAIKCWAAMQFITHLLSPNQAEFSICLQVAISTFQWKLIS